MGFRKLNLLGIFLILFSLFFDFKYIFLSMWWYLSDIFLLFILLIWIIRVSYNEYIITKKSFYIIFLFIYFLGIGILLAYFYHPLYLKTLKYLYVYSIFFFSFVIFRELEIKELWLFMFWGDILALIILKNWFLGSYTWIYKYGEIEILRKEIITGFGQTNTLCYPMLFIIFLELLFLKYRIYGNHINLIIYSSIFLQSITIFLIQSRMGMFLLFVIYFYYILLNFKHFNVYNLLIFIFFILGIFVFFRDLIFTDLYRFFLSLSIELNASYELSRLNLWKYAINIIKNKPFYGIGFGNIGLPIGIWDRDVQAHNIFLDVFSGVGILGGISYFLMFSIILYEFYKYANKFKEIFLLFFLVFMSYSIEPIYGSHHFSIFFGIYLSCLINFYKILIYKR